MGKTGYLNIWLPNKDKRKTNLRKYNKNPKTLQVEDVPEEQFKRVSVKLHLLDVHLYTGLHNCWSLIRWTTGEILGLFFVFLTNRLTDPDQGRGFVSR